MMPKPIRPWRSVAATLLVAATVSCSSQAPVDDGPTVMHGPAMWPTPTISPLPMPPPEPPRVASAPSRAAPPTPASAYSDEDYRREPTELEKAVDARVALVTAELDALDRSDLPPGHWAREWAGTYSFANGDSDFDFRLTVMIAPENGAVCTGRYYGGLASIIEADERGLSLKLERPTSVGGLSFLKARMLFVAWGKRRYLVPEGEEMKFVNEFNQGGANRQRMYGFPYRRVDDRPNDLGDAAPPGLPQLPAPFAALLRENPIKLTVTAVRDVERKASPFDKGARTSARLDLKGGSDAGVFNGMEFKVRGVGPYAGGFATIESVEPSVCTARYSSYAAEPPVVGQDLLTGEDPRRFRLEVAVHERSEQIERELKTLDRKRLSETDWAREWAGIYVVGDGLSEAGDIRLAPESGVAWSVFGGCDLVGQYHGTVAAYHGDGITVSFAADAEDSAWTPALPTPRLFFVRWDSRRYLVPEKQMIRFVNQYNVGGMVRYHMPGIPQMVVRTPAGEIYYDERVPRGWPELPQKYSRLLRNRPITLTVSRVGESPEPVAGDPSRVRVRLDFAGGEDAGAYVGLEFAYVAGSVDGAVRIDRAEAAACSGTFEPRVQGTPAPAAGDVVETAYKPLPGDEIPWRPK